MGSNSGEFAVVPRRKEVVAAVLPMQEHWLPMSNLDLLLPPLDVSVFFCYKKTNIDDNISATATLHGRESISSRVGTLKKALAQALVSFYAFAGELVENRLGEPELLCNNRGVDFIHAYADVELNELDLHHPDDSVHGKLVPLKSRGVLAIQVTELKCGGLVIGCTFDHRVADAYSANMFVVAWAHIARTPNASPPTIPSFRRSLLNPRRPGRYHPSIDNMCVLLSSPPLHSDAKEPEHNEENGNGDGHLLISRIYYVDAEEINHLQLEANCMNLVEGGKGRRSKLEAFTAFLWKLIATAGDDISKRCKMGVVVDGRERLNKRSGGRGYVNGDKADYFMQNYFGNVLSVPYGEETVGKLKAMDLSQVANIVHECIAQVTNEEHFLGLIDWVESHRPEKAIVKVYRKEDTDEAAVVVSSGQRFPVTQVDFGWGSPDFGSYHFPWGGQTGYVMPMPSASRDGDWIVYMHLLKKHLDLVESKAAHIFKPLSASYLDL